VNFQFSDEQAMLRDAACDLLAKYAPTAAARVRPDDDVDPALWRLAGELGWSGLALPEEYGGSGQGLVELALVAEQIGRAAARGPFLSTALVGRAVARRGAAALRAGVLPVLAAGTGWATWAFAEPGAPWTPQGVRAIARTDGADVVLDGVKTMVPHADGARWLLVTAREQDRVASFLVDRDDPGITVRRQQTLDLTRTSY
jgi:alkylation response protein AidB-like acyl-CoA dehydrogenase